MIEILNSIVGQVEKSFATLECSVQTFNEISQKRISSYSSFLSFYAMSSTFNLIMLTAHFVELNQIFIMSSLTSHNFKINIFQLIYII